MTDSADIARMDRYAALIASQSVSPQHARKIKRSRVPATQNPRTASDLGPTLAAFRKRAGLSQSKLAERADYDHSFVCRIERGTRGAARDTVNEFAIALNLNEHDKDALLAAAGFIPRDIMSLLTDEPVIGEVLTLLRDAAISDERKDALRQQLTLSMRMARMVG